MAQKCINFLCNAKNDLLLPILISITYAKPRRIRRQRSEKEWQIIDLVKKQKEKSEGGNH